ncbi:hypothetical protein [Rhizobium laguerreae]|uniref:hypothetical protein n=1 Tax=Rhizobium laguerreae TaxID=1076926 RepID=UPI001C911B2F|nr:hypothetical protein [Rhizobium laguerreae]MBY3139043.1 hypothetical protein [Rhizobium laguerreae]
MGEPRLADTVTTYLLRAYFGKQAPDRMIDDVLYDVVPLGAIERNYTVRLFLNPSGLIPAALILKAKGPGYLAAHSLNDIEMMLRGFFYSNYPIIWRELKTEEFDGSVFDVTSESGRRALADTMERSSIFSPRPSFTAFPITPIVVKSDFECENFSLIDLHSLAEGNADWLREQYLDNMDVGGWLVVKAASVEAATRDKRIILGALALALGHQNRHAFTLREVAKGFLRFPGAHAISTSSSGPHTPPIGGPIIIDATDHDWLNLIPRILARSTSVTKRHGKALEYYYRAWFMDESDRCFLLFMSLDAIFGQDGNGFAAGMKEGVKRTLNKDVDEKRLDALLRIRNTMLHGGAPDLFASSNYLKYAEKHFIDPATDIQLLVAKCLRLHIFGKLFRPQGNPDINVLQFAEAQGLIPSEREDNSIITEWP